jgi:hypothetical protein
MLYSTYQKERDRLRKEMLTQHEMIVDLHNRRTVLRNEQGSQKGWDARDFGREFAQINVELDSCHDTLERFQRDQEQLEAEAEKGFDYVRPGRNIVNRFLPKVRQGVKDVDTKQLHEREYPRVLAVACAAIACILMALVAKFATWVLWGGYVGLVMLPPDFPVTDRLVGFNAAIMAGTGVYLFALRALDVSPWFDKTVVEVQARFVLDAESWTWWQRLRSCLVYAIFSPWTLVVAGLAIPIRFGIGLASTSVYLRRLNKGDGQNDAIMVSGRFVALFTRVMYGIAGVALGALALYLLK